MKKKKPLQTGSPALGKDNAHQLISQRWWTHTCSLASGKLCIRSTRRTVTLTSASFVLSGSFERSGPFPGPFPVFLDFSPTRLPLFFRSPVLSSSLSLEESELPPAANATGSKSSHPSFDSWGLLLAFALGAGRGSWAPEPNVGCDTDACIRLFWPSGRGTMLLSPTGHAVGWAVETANHRKTKREMRRKTLLYVLCLGKNSVSNCLLLPHLRTMDTMMANFLIRPFCDNVELRCYFQLCSSLLNGIKAFEQRCFVPTHCVSLQRPLMSENVRRKDFTSSWS
jgi:hypothetical protein